MRPLSDSDVTVARFTMSHLLGLDMLSLSTSHKDAFFATLEMLALDSKVSQSKVFISKALAQTSFIFPALN